MTRSFLKLNPPGLSKLNLLAYASSVIISSVAYSSHAAIIINEIDYDQPGSDTAEFIELFNAGTSTISLNSYSISLINKTASAVYRSIDLSGFNINANDYLSSVATQLR